MLAAMSETLTCSKCGCSSSWREAFTAGKDGTAPRTWCPPCAEKQEGRNGMLSLGSAVFMIFVGGYNLGNHPGNLFHELTVGWGVFTLSLILMVWPHELAHVFVARWMGFRTIAICVGTGPVLFERNWFGVRVSLRRGLHGGLAYVDIREVPGFDGRMIAIYLAGAIANLSCGIAALAVAQAMSERISGVPMVALLAFGLANLFLVTGALWPRSFSRDSHQLRTDGGLILDRLRGVPVDFREHEAQMRLLLAHCAYHERRFADAVREATRAESLSAVEQVKVEALVCKAESLSESDQPRAAVELLRPLLERVGLSEWHRIHVAQSFAWAALLTDEPLLIEEAIGHSERCWLQAPWSDVYLIKHICLLAAGVPANPDRAGEARGLLEQLAGFSLQGESMGYGALARSLVAAVNGNPGVAKSEYESARKRRVTAAPLRLLERRLASP